MTLRAQMRHGCQNLGGTQDQTMQKIIQTFGDYAPHLLQELDQGPRHAQAGRPQVETGDSCEGFLE